MAKTHVLPKMRKRSQALRRQLTKSETLLWNELRDLRKLRRKFWVLQKHQLKTPPVQLLT